MAKFIQNEHDRLMSRVRKLLTLGNDAGATEGERDNAMRMAHALLAKHNLDLATVASAHGEEGRAEADAAEPRIDHSQVFGSWPWALYTAQAIAGLFFCTYLHAKGRSLHFGNHYFVGRTSNATTAALVAEFVVKSIYSEGCKRMRAGRHGNPFLRSFCWGAMLAVVARCDSLRTATPSPSPDVANTPATPGTALVLASVYETEAEANRQYVQRRWGRGVVKGGRSRAWGATDHSAREQGAAYGKNVSLSAQLK